jgi:hypothetical protein
VLIGIKQIEINKVIFNFNINNMINLKKIRVSWLKTRLSEEEIDQQDYKKHFQMAVINLERNLIEERLPELQKTA